MLLLQSTCVSVYIYFFKGKSMQLTKLKLVFSAVIYTSILYLFERWGHLILYELQ